MKRLHRLVVCTSVVSIAAVVFGMTAAFAQGAGPSRVVPPSSLVLSIYRGEDTSSGSLLSQVILTCDPDGGTHPQASAACNALRSVDGNINALPSDHVFCPLFYAPITATAWGWWQGQWVAFQRTYGNTCELHRAAKPVFEF